MGSPTDFLMVVLGYLFLNISLWMVLGYFHALSLDKCILKRIIQVKPELKHCKIYFYQQVTNIFANLVPLKQTFEQGSAAVC